MPFSIKSVNLNKLKFVVLVHHYMFCLFICILFCFITNPLTTPKGMHRFLSNPLTSLNYKGRRLIYLVLAFFAIPGQWQRFIPFQSKGKLRPRNSLFQSNTAFIVLTLFLTLKIFRPTVFSQSMSSTKLKWLFCVPNFCWAQMAICPMRYVDVLLYSLPLLLLSTADPRMPSRLGGRPA
jgi:hypothetical protein